MSDERIDVIAYSGYRSEEIPRSFILRNENIKVIEIHDMWIEEDLQGMTRRRFFKVRGSDGFIHKIYHDEKTKEWFICKK